MSRGTDVIYNNVQLVNCTTRQWSQEVRWDDSNTQAVGQAFDLEFQCVVTTSFLNQVLASAGPYVGFSPSNAVGGNAPNVYDAIRNVLMEPRRDLRILMNGNVMLSVPSCHKLSHPLRDIENGPKPISFNIQHVAGDQAFLITWKVRAVQSPCGARATTDATSVMSNRWDISESMDANHAVTRRIVGQMVLTTSEIPGHLYKYLVVPPLEKGFRRDEIDFEVQRDGLKCNYTVVDRQIDHAAPWPATRMSVNRTIFAKYGIQSVSQVDISLEAPPGTDRTLLISRAFQIAYATVNVRGAIESSRPDAVLEEAVLSEHFGDTCSLNLRMVVKDTADKPFQIIKRDAGKVLKLPALRGVSYDWQGSFEPPLFGSTPHGPRSAAVLATLHTYLQTPCSPRKSVGVREPSSEKGKHKNPNATPTRITERPVDAVPTPRQQYSSDATHTVWTHSVVRTRYLRNNMRAHLPRARAPRQNRSPSLIQLGVPLGQKIIIIDAERVGSYPKIPSPEQIFSDNAGRDDLYVMDHYVEMLPPVLSSDGVKFVYRIKAYYLLAMPEPMDHFYQANIATHGYTNFDGRVRMGEVFE